MPRVDAIFKHLTVPFLVSILYSIWSIISHWFIAVSAIIAGYAFIKIKRPQFWEKFLLTAPFIKSVTLPLYYHRYYRKRSEGKAHEQALESTSNSLFDPYEQIEHVKENYPLIALAVETDKQYPDTFLAEDCKDLSSYTQKTFDYAMYNLKEIFDYSCIAIFLVVTLTLGIVFLEIA